MVNEEINYSDKSVDDIKKEIKSLEEDIIKKQEDCSHDKHSIKFDNDKKSVIRICDECNKTLGYATNTELEDNGFI